MTSRQASRAGDHWLLLPALLGAVLLAYQPAWYGGMLWDDQAHITPAALRSTAGLWRIWFEPGVNQQYYPVTYSAFWLMFRLWGEHTLGYHIVNIVLHSLSAFTLAAILRRLRVPGALLAAAIFALHPVHVESVAWMTELKNTLSGFLYLTSAAVYLSYLERRNFGRYAFALGLFLLAVLSKTVAVTLPAALLVVSWWQHGRLSWREDVKPLVPFFIVGAGGGLLTIWLEQTVVGAAGSSFQFTFLERCLIAGRALWFYLGKLVWPANLIFIYPRWSIDGTVWWQYLYPAAAIALAAGLAWYARAGRRAPLAALLFFGGTLFPALGFFNVFPFQFSFVADHFQYLASIGPIVLVAAVAHLLVERSLTRQTRLAGVVAVAAVLAILSWRQSRQYADVKTLYRTTIEANPACWLAENNLGDVLFNESPGNLSEAIGHFQRAIAIKPDYAVAHNNLGTCWRRLNRLDDAAREFAEAARLEPQLVAAHFNLGDAQREMGRLDEAAASFEASLRLKPDYTEARNNLAGVLLERGKVDEATAEIETLVRLDPQASGARANFAKGLIGLANARANEGQRDVAIDLYERALRLEPESGEAHNNLAGILMSLGRVDEAVIHFEQAVRFLPGSAAVRENLMNARAEAQARRK